MARHRSRGARRGPGVCSISNRRCIESGGAAHSVRARQPLPGTDRPELLVRLRVPNSAEFDVRRLDALVEMVKPAHVPHRVEVTGA